MVIPVIFLIIRSSCITRTSNITLKRCFLFLQTRDLQNELNKVPEKIEQSSQVVSCETKREQTGHDSLASLLNAEKERVAEITEECNSLRCSLETLEKRNEVLENETKNMQKEVEELQESIKGLESQLLESKKACDVSKEQL